jgi:NAD(P)-dependent dehydrogenase (short-subunit alcohol dehydrogenase family)
VAPGVILTPFHERYSTEEQIRGMVATIPQGRAGTAQDFEKGIALTKAPCHAIEMQGGLFGHDAHS